MKRLLLFVCLGMTALLAGCASSSSMQELTPFETLTLERARARAGRAAIMGIRAMDILSADRTATSSVTVTRIGGRSITAGYDSIIVDAVPQSIGIRLDDGSEQFFRMPLKIGKRYLVMAYRHTLGSDKATENKATKESLDWWVQEADTGTVVYGEKSAAAEAALQRGRLAQWVERHQAHLQSLTLDTN